MFASAFLILLLFSISNIVVNFSFVSGQSEKDLLLELRNNLTYNSSVSIKLVQWNASVNFCQWRGVECDEKGRVSGLDLSGESISNGINGADCSLFKLKHLQSLSLAQNRFNYTQFPSGFGQLTELRLLNLRNSEFSGQIPSDLSNLTRLVFLDLSHDSFDLLPQLPDLRGLIRNLTSLRELFLDRVNISANGNEWGSALSSSLPNLRVLSMISSHLTGPFHPSLLKLRFLSNISLDFNSFSSPFPDFFVEFPNLKALSLSYCDLSGVVPAKLFQITRMQTINLEGNENLGGSLPEFPVNGSLEKLVLGGPRFSGTLPESIGNLRMLSLLSVEGSNISGPIPSTIKNLTRLVDLFLSENRFSGSVPSFAFLKSLSFITLRGNRLTGPVPDSLWVGLDNLTSLDLSENSLQGQIPASIFLLPVLESLLLSNNNFSGTINVETKGLSPLSILNLSINKLQGSIPRILFELRNLSLLYLSSNMFSGFSELNDFQKQTDLRNQSEKVILDLSDNELDGEIPNWIWEVGGGSKLVLDLSHNRFTHLQEPYDLRNVRVLNLRANMLAGQIPFPLSSAEVLDFSDNHFSSLSPDIGNSLRNVTYFAAADNMITGTIPPSFCNISSLTVLDLSFNRFHREIPSCLLNSTIGVLNLRRNFLDGDIPDTFPVGSLLETLDLSRNFLRGKLPESLTRCSKLRVLDLSNNKLRDTFPCWLNTLSQLRVLALRANGIHGNISCLVDANSWQDLQIIDLASNNISGIIPAKMFRNLQGFMIDGTQQHSEQLHFENQIFGLYYQDSVTVGLKGNEYQLEKILRIFTSIDLSGNHLQGVIPEEIGELRSLFVLNFSHNALSGHIPSSMGKLKELGSLDLSFNNLHGEIPQELANLTFLSALNFSYNNLVGRIPQGSQLRTFTETSFLGNDGLCGFPVNKACIDDASPQGEQERDEEYSSEREMYVSAALGFVVGLGFIVAPLMFCKRWRSYYSKQLTRIILFVLRQQNRRGLRNANW